METAITVAPELGQDPPLSSSLPPPQNDPRLHLGLLRAVVGGDLQKVTTLLEADRGLIKAKISLESKTALHVAITGGECTPVVRLLADLMSAEEMEAAVDDGGRTVLHEAAMAGNLEAARLVLCKNTRLGSVLDRSGHAPLHSAALCGHEGVVRYLLGEVVNDRTQGAAVFQDGPVGREFLSHLIVAGFYDMAIEVIHRYPNIVFESQMGSNPQVASANQSPEPHVARSMAIKCINPLAALAKRSLEPHVARRSVFVNEKCIYVPCREDAESSDMSSEQEDHNCWNSYPICSAHYGILGLDIPKFGQGKGSLPYLILNHFRALQLAKCLCKISEKLQFTEHTKIFSEAIHAGIKHGNREFVREIIKSFPYAIWFRDKNELNTLQAAVVHRQVKVFNLLWEMGNYCNIQCLSTQSTNGIGNNILHLVAKLASPDSLNVVSGPALQMQRELQWFKMVESRVHPSLKEELDGDGRTPIMVFDAEHKELVKEGEKWMKGTANYCTVVAALIATATFAAQITVPGGNDEETGHPLFLSYKQRTSQRGPFLIFSILNAVSLVSCIASVGVFLSIVTARCAASDFFFSLPAKLVIGLLTLLLSLVCMLLAFAIILLLLFDLFETYMAFLTFCVVTVAAVVLGYHFYLLKDTISCTLGDDIFSGVRRKSFTSFAYAYVMPLILLGLVLGVTIIAPTPGSY